MKKFFAIILVALLVIPLLYSKADAGQFGQLLIELETSVNFSAQTTQWRARRNGWINEVRAAGSNLAALKRLLIEFETNVNYSAQVSTWSQQRNAWIARVNNARNLRELGEAMIEVETSINYSAQVPSWRNRRNAWIASVRAATY
ncbi:MAG: hypothetical protein N2316_04535 [Spirochaetes bacterium]|nr:hypothetical protein [Spirochaetota bacterium]